jgi:hypothetical protein
MKKTSFPRKETLLKIQSNFDETKTAQAESTNANQPFKISNANATNAKITNANKS